MLTSHHALVITEAKAEVSSRVVAEVSSYTHKKIARPATALIV